MNTITADIAIIGGGIAGLWLLNLLSERGYSTLLIEKDALGSSQTLASQGMIHGGIKYTLSGTKTGASETIKDMPSRWQSCLEGHGSVDLRNVQLLSKDYFLFSDASLTSRVTAFFGSKAIEGRIEQLSRDSYPAAFDNPGFKGALYKLQDVVIDTPSLLETLSARYQNQIIKSDPTINVDNKAVTGLRLPGIGEVQAKQVILAAGEGNGAILEKLGAQISMQRRPLHQVIVTGDLPPLYAHAVSLGAGDKPRMTITTHPVSNGNAWYLGGQLAESGVARSEVEQIGHARAELASIFPWIDFSSCNFSTLRINRAEPSQLDAGRPDTPFVKKTGNVIVCWPTKLTLVPLMGDLVLPLLTEATGRMTDLQAEAPRIGDAPWS